MKLEQWLKLNIRKKLVQMFLSVMIVVLPVVLIGSYLYNQYQLEKFLVTVHKPVLVALQTGDLLSLQKSLSYLKDDSKVIGFQVYDSYQQIVVSKNESHENNQNTFTLKKNIFGSTGQSFGSISIHWKINYFQIVFSVFLLGIIMHSVYFLIHRKLIALVFQISESIKSLPSDVDKGSPSHLFNEIHELNDVYSKLVTAKENISLNENLNYQLKQQESLTKIAQKLAHDIRSPISSLNIIAHKIENPHLKELQQQVVHRINDIAEDMLNQAKNNSIKNNMKKINLGDLCLLLQQEYHLELGKEASSDAITFHCDASLKTLEAKNIKILYPIIKNLINNSIEATNVIGRKIQVRLETQENQEGYQIKVIDNGKGIPAEVQTKIGKEQVSFGKEHSNLSGNGIAIWNAYKDLATIKAHMTFLSRPEENTQFTIFVPLI